MPESMLLLGIGDLSSKAPEQIAGREPGPQADIFALGAIFFQLITGKQAFGNSNPIESALLKASCPVGWPKDRPRKIPDSAIKLIHKCLARKPEQRFKSIAQVSKLLKQIAAGKFVWIPVRREFMKDAPEKPPYTFYSLFALLILAIGASAGFYQFKYLPEQRATQTAVVAALIAMQPTATMTSSPTATITPTPTATFTITPTSIPTSTPTPLPTYAAQLDTANITQLQLIGAEDFTSTFRQGRMPEGVKQNRVKPVLEFSPNSEYLAASGISYSGVVLNAEDLSKIQSVSGRIPPGNAFSPDSKALAIIAYQVVDLPVSHLVVPGEYLQLVSPTDATNKPPLGPYDELSEVKYTPDGKLIVLGSSRKTRTYDVSTGQEIEIREGGEFGCQVNRSKTSREFISAYSSAGFLFEWNPLTQFICSYAKSNSVLSPDHTRLVYINSHGLIQVDQMPTGKMLWRTPLPAKSFIFSSDNQMLAVNADGKLSIWDAATGEKISEYSDQVGDAAVLAFSPDGKRVALMSESGKINLFGVFTQ